MKIDLENFKEIPFLKNYLCSPNGLIYDVKRKKLKKSYPTDQGYLKYSFSINGIRIFYKAHRLVALTFLPNPNNKRCVNHKNGIKTDNRVSNLEWATHSENTIHAIAIGLLKPLDNSNKGRVIIDVVTNERFNSLTKASEKVNIKRSTLSAMLCGQNPNKTNLKYLQNE